MRGEALRVAARPAALALERRAVRGAFVGAEALRLARPAALVARDEPLRREQLGQVGVEAHDVVSAGAVAQRALPVGADGAVDPDAAHYRAVATRTTIPAAVRPARTSSQWSDHQALTGTPGSRERRGVRPCRP